MTARRVGRVLASLCLASSAVVALLPAPSSAASPQATGWWSRRLPLQGEAGAGAEGEVTGLASRAAVRFAGASTPRQLPTEPTIPVPGGDDGTAPVTTIPLPVPVPTVPDSPVPLPDEPGPGTANPTVPDGGLWVANDPSGPVAISALRYRGDIGAGELTLRFAPGTTTPGPMVACPALSAFDPVEGGAWPDRPAHDCERLSLTGRLSADGTGMQFTIPQGFLPFGQRVLDVVILPDPARGDTFSAYFEPPGEDSLVVSQGQQLPPPVAELPEPDPSTLPPSAFDVPPFDAGTSFADVPSPVPTTEAPAPADDGEEVAAPRPIAELLEPFTESRTGRIISVAVLLAMGAALWLFGGQPVRHPKLLGALAGDAPALIDQSASSTGRGIGRFRRARVTLPHRL